MMKMKNLMMLALVVCSMMMVGCGEDKPEPQPTPGKTVAKKMTVDASNYANWTYINLETGETEVHRDFSSWTSYKDDTVISHTPAKGSESDVKIKWHIAIHRFDVKTNGAEAVATTETELDKVTTLPTAGYKTDTLVRKRVITDMSKMMQGIVGYADEETLNATLGGWLILTPTGTMPPYTYKLSGKVYVVKFKSGANAKLKFTDYSDATGRKKGVVTFSYVYQAK